MKTHLCAAVLTLGMAAQQPPMADILTYLDDPYAATGLTLDQWLSIFPPERHVASPRGVRPYAPGMVEVAYVGNLGIAIGPEGIPTGHYVIVRFAGPPGGPYVWTGQQVYIGYNSLPAADLGPATP